MKNKFLNQLPDLSLIASITFAILIGGLFPGIHLFPASLRHTFGLILVIGGLGASIAVLSYIRHHGASTDVMTTSKTLITKGCFSLSRNPLYLAESVATIGASIYTGSLVSFIAPVMYISIMNFVVISYEEKKLEKLFDDEYRRYKQSTRRWL